jgi:hypothetical protein
MPKTRFHRAGAALAALVPVGFVLAIACKPADADKTPYGTSIPTDTKVTITVAGRQLSIAPQIFLMRPGDTIDFVAEGLASGATLEMDFKVERGFKGPFGRDPKAIDPRGRYSFSEKVTRFSATYEKALGEGVWKYEVVLRDNLGNDLAAIDPMGVGKGGG